jgi:rubredoxin
MPKSAVPTALPAAVPSGDTKMTEATEQKYICTSCGFIYEPAEGDPDGGIPPETPFADIPEDWFCPVCGARKRDFEPYEG